MPNTPYKLYFSDLLGDLFFHFDKNFLTFKRADLPAWNITHYICPWDLFLILSNSQKDPKLPNRGLFCAPAELRSDPIFGLNPLKLLESWTGPAWACTLCDISECVKACQMWHKLSISRPFSLLLVFVCLHLGWEHCKSTSVPLVKRASEWCCLEEAAHPSMELISLSSLSSSIILSGSCKRSYTNFSWSFEWRDSWLNVRKMKGKQIFNTTTLYYHYVL